MFDLKSDDELHILLYQNLTSKGTENVKNIKWSDWCEFLTRPVVGHDKYANKLAIYGDVADSEGISHRRLKENVMYRQVFSLDYDDIDDMNRFLDNVKVKMKYFAYFIYSTYRHRDTHDEKDKTLRPRFRLLVPIDDILEPDEYTKYAGALSRYIGEVIDESCFKPSQLSALPVISSKDAPFHWYMNDAPFITRNQLDDCLNKYHANATEDKSQNIVVRYKKRDSAFWRDIAFGVAEGERNQTLASLIGYLLRRYVDAHLVYGLASSWAMTCTPPLEQEEVNKTFNSIYKKHTNNI
ncbi:primase alpha helix C-terminal domain-containing protein [Staphylococcus felis]|uniref:primase alpha helix C-terminal domain-containing protein n=1 Tax=Staphylococcus felis TaxID=46127 RepID=UPI0039679D21